MRVPWPLAAANLALLVVFPVTWFLPILRAGLMPLFGLSEVTVVTGLQSLWQSEPALAVLVSFLALFAPVAKSGALALVQFGLLSARALPAVALLGKLAMADMFLIALYVVALKGIGIGRVEVAWGLYAFTGAVLAAILLGWLTERRLARP